jgi:FtsP/CotA-like multicopper oxidase with cupredoxin domain
VLEAASSTATYDTYEIVQSKGTAEIIPGYSTPIWGYNGLYPGPTIKVRKGREVRIRHVNRLRDPVTVHTHGIYEDGDNDGHPNNLIQPKRAKTYFLGNNQNARTLWYHDHTEHLTAKHLYKGLAGFYLIGDEFEDNLPLPKGEYDVPLIIQDRIFNGDGTLNYPPHGVVVSDDGFLGDVIVVNGKAQPRFAVATRKYRFRILNASNARPYTLALSNGQPFTLIGTEGGLLETPISLTSLPIWPAERYEIVIDFSNQLNSQIILKNTHPLGSETPGGSGTTQEIMRFDVVRSETDEEVSIPNPLRPAAQQVDPTHQPADPADAVITRRWEFGRKRSRTGGPLYVINGKTYDKYRIDASPREGDTEIWEFINPLAQSQWSHPVHLHLTNFKILDRNGRPPPSHETGWKETVILKNPGDRVRVLIKWPEVPLGAQPEGKFTRKYVFHCHNLEHEDHDMMAQFKVVP